MPLLQGTCIAVADPGDPSDPATHSGNPASLLRAIAELGGEPVALPGSLPGRLEATAIRAAIVARLRPADRRDLPEAARRRRPAAELSSTLVRLRAAAMARRLAGREVDGIISYGTEVTVPGTIPLVTYEDATLPLALRTWDWPHLRHLSDRDLARYRRRQLRAYDRASACGAMSHWAGASMVQDCHQPPGKVHVIGVGATHRTQAPVDRDLSTPRFLFIGTDWERKNGPGLLRAFARLRAEIPSATLDVVGAHPRIAVEGVEGHGALELGDERGAEKIRQLYARATCFAMPSLHEPLGIVFAEALHAGLPAIGSSSGGSATIVGDAGLVVDPHDDEAILGALRRCADPVVAAELSARARERAPLFTWTAVVERLVGALDLPGLDRADLAADLPPL